MTIESTLKTLPNDSGVYIYRDKDDTVIYVGKARNLKNRVRSYFHANDLSEKTKKLVENIADIQYIVTANELEALLLENNLIKQYKPKYNILLKDDKGYPYLKINLKNPFPRLELSRKLTYDGSLYFGPYHGATSARAIADIACEFYPLRSCNFDLSKNVKPCLKYQIGKCPAPCVFKDEKSYQRNVSGVVSFLKGNQKEVIDAFYQKMMSASEKQEYELAAKYRDKLARAGEILSKQKVVLDKNEDIDVLACVLKDTYGVICSMFIRSGRITGVTFAEQENIEYESESQLLAKYILQHYTSGVFIPKEILCHCEPEDNSLLCEILSASQNRKVIIKRAQRGKKAELCAMARKNAIEHMQKSTAHLTYRDKRAKEGLEQLKTILNLKEIPTRLECFDISHIQGTDTVASMVVFTSGLPDRHEYRHFKIKHLGNDDFESMREVVSRRFTDALNKKRGFEKLPDLIIIDGGKGQLSVAKAILDELGLNIKIISLAEKLEEVFIPNQSMPIIIPHSAPSLQLLQAIRDEAHRFAITFHRSLRSKRSILSVLDEIDGIGKKRKAALMKAFRSVANLENASLDEIAAVEGINKPSAIAVFEYFQNRKKTSDMGRSLKDSTTRHENTLSFLKN